MSTLPKRKSFCFYILEYSGNSDFCAVLFCTENTKASIKLKFFKKYLLEGSCELMYCERILNFKFSMNYQRHDCKLIQVYLNVEKGIS